MGRPWREHWGVEMVKLPLMDRLTGRTAVWVPPQQLCNERGCFNGRPEVTSTGKCRLCEKRLGLG